jgi:hypothetical protein
MRAGRTARGRQSDVQQMKFAKPLDISSLFRENNPVIFPRRMYRGIISLSIRYMRIKTAEPLEIPYS